MSSSSQTIDLVVTILTLRRSQQSFGMDLAEMGPARALGEVGAEKGDRHAFPAELRALSPAGAAKCGPVRPPFPNGDTVSTHP